MHGYISLLPDAPEGARTQSHASSLLISLRLTAVAFVSGRRRSAAAASPTPEARACPLVGVVVQPTEVNESFLSLRHVVKQASEEGPIKYMRHKHPPGESPSSACSTA